MRKSSYLDRLLFVATGFVLALAVTTGGHSTAKITTALTDNPTNADKSPRAKTRFTKLDGARIHYVNYGKGDEAQVLIHGWTQNIDAWRDQFADFAKRNRVIAIDLPGHGQSDKPQLNYSMEYFARAVEAVMRD